MKIMTDKQFRKELEKALWELLPLIGWACWRTARDWWREIKRAQG